MRFTATLGRKRENLVFSTGLRSLTGVRSARVGQNASLLTSSHRPSWVTLIISEAPRGLGQIEGSSGDSGKLRWCLQ